ncbi:ABC transporter ATP-binding protein/permease [Salana multivorans]|uniref:ABC transporter ATP-binding protein/permease n=1 Tax=Salana multivorans TaxID=120377 RepID=UPI000B04AB9A|nr:ABC transporter ATP-binding protein/permease [Salana multivorans]
MAKRGFTGAMMRGYGARDHVATVTGIERLAPHFVRLRFHSDTLLQDGNTVVAPTAYLRFWFPDHEGRDVEHQRGYTLSEADAATGDFAVDVVLHEPAGPASAWAQRAEIGTAIQVTALGSTRFDLPEELPAGYLLVGDAASIPAINAILGELPAEVPVELYLEEHDADDRLIPLAAHPRATVHWVPRRGETSLAAAIEARDWSDWYAWTAPESGSLKHLRTRLRDEFGFPRSEVHAQAYWYYGRAFGSNRSKAAPEPVPSTEVVPDAGAAASPSTDVPADPPADAVASGAAASAADTSEAGTTTSPRGRWRAQAGGRLLAPLRGTLVVAGVTQALVTLVQLAPFVLLVELSRLLLSGADARSLWTVGLWAVGLMTAGVVGSSALLLWLHRVDARFARDLRQRLLGKLARLPLGWFDARGSGQVKQLVQDDTLALHYLVTHAVGDAVAAVVAPVAVLVYLVVVDWRIALLLLLPVLAYLVVMAIMVVQSGARTAEALRWAERMNVEAGAYLEGQPVVRVFGGAAASRFRARLQQYVTFLDDWQRPLTGQKAFIDLVTRPATFLLLICSLGTLLITTGRMDPVTLLPFLLLGTTFGPRLLGVGYGLSGLRTGLLAARRIQVTLDEPELETDDEAAPGTPAAAPPGRVELDGVGFSYRPGVPVLHDVSLTLEPGTVTALVGPSGSGKSTLAALLARFHDVGTGAIRIGGRDLRELTADELYTRVGFVFQQTQLVHGTVRENIALAVPDADDEAVEAAARAAQLHERILRLPRGYDTVLGPDAALSGGERQRLTIARALLADTPVLVLDEATAFADPESEYLVQRALDRLTVGRTVVVIAHRLHTVTGVDRIVVLDHGRVAQTGTHAELLARDGRYRELWLAGEHARTTEPEPVLTAGASPLDSEVAR